MGRGWLTFLARDWLSARRDPKFRAFQSVQGSMAIIVQNVTPSRSFFFPFGGAARWSSPNNWDAKTPICGCFGAKPAGTTPAYPVCDPRLAAVGEEMQVSFGRVE